MTTLLLGATGATERLLTEQLLQRGEHVRVIIRAPERLPDWVLDIAFRKDECRIRKGNGPQNFAVLRHIALNLLKHNSRSKLGLKNRRLRAGWDDDYLFSVLHPLFS